MVASMVELEDTPRARPHWPQKRKPSGTVAPQVGQTTGIGGAALTWPAGNCEPTWGSISSVPDRGPSGSDDDITGSSLAREGGCKPIAALESNALSAPIQLSR